MLIYAWIWKDSHTLIMQRRINPAPAACFAARPSFEDLEPAWEELGLNMELAEIEFMTRSAARYPTT
jgi:hypothetical protein